MPNARLSRARIPEGHRQARLLGHPTDTKHDQEDDTGEELGRTLSGYQPKRGAQRKPTEGQNDDQRQDRLHEGRAQRHQNPCARAAQERHQCQQGYDGEVLEQQNGEGESAVRAAEFASLDQGMEHDRRGREGESGAHDKRRGAFEPERAQRSPECQRGDRDLRGPEAEHKTPEGRQSLGGELEPDREQQEHHTELREHRSGLDIVEQIQAVGADEGSRDEIPQHRAHPKVAKERNHSDRGSQDDEKVLEVRRAVHARPRAGERAKVG